ncbi:MAG: methyltransferase domain-containing protein [Pirellulales bacterium]
MKTTKASIYDFPKYYDLVFGSDTAAEITFLKDCIKKHVKGKVKRLFEPACGTGRLLFRLGKEGYEVGGIDLNSKAVDFCNARLKKLKLKGQAQVGDMSDFEVAKPFDIGFNTINSFRHLLTEESAKGHLVSMAKAIRLGGIYALGFHLTPTHAEPDDEESWSARRGQLMINTQMWPVSKDKKKRLECFGIRFDIYTPTDTMKINDVLRLRSYTAKQFQSLVDSVSDLWEPVEHFDFGYDIKSPIKIDGTTQDVITIFKRI